jgi:hypothetical protein
MKNFEAFRDRFCLLPRALTVGNLSVGWWGNPSPGRLFGAAATNFRPLAATPKIDEGFFGRGFYLTRFPRYSDYYVSGCDLRVRAQVGD